MTLIDPVLHPLGNPLFALIAGKDRPERIRAGIYSGVAFNFELLLNTGSAHDWDPFPSNLPGDLEASYGVVDSMTQFLERFGDALEADVQGYCLGFTRVSKGEQPASGGWRWHKWGPYLGMQEPQHEYLHDEEYITEVYCFQLFRHKSWRMGGVYGQDDES